MESEWNGARSLIDFSKLVEERLNQRGLSEAVKSWKEIWARYDDGGPEAVESDLQKQLKALKSVASKEMKEASSVVPKKARNRRRR